MKGGGRRRLIREGGLVAWGRGQGGGGRARGRLGRGGGVVRVRETREVGRPARLGLGPVERDVFFNIPPNLKKSQKNN